MCYLTNTVDYDERCSQEVTVGGVLPHNVLVPQLDWNKGPEQLAQFLDQQVKLSLNNNKSIKEHFIRGFFKKCKSIITYKRQQERPDHLQDCSSHKHVIETSLIVLPQTATDFSVTLIRLLQSDFRILFGINHEIKTFKCQASRILGKRK